MDPPLLTSLRFMNYHCMDPKSQRISHFLGLSLGVAISKAPIRFIFNSFYMISVIRALFSHLKSATLSLFATLLRQAACICGILARVTINDIEPNNFYFIAGISKSCLNMLIKPLKVLIMADPVASKNSCSLNTIKNLTSFARQNTDFKKQDTPITPTQFRVSPYPAISIREVLESRSAKLGIRVFETNQLLSSAAVMSVLLRLTQKA